MIAYRFQPGNKTLVKEELPRPVVGPNEVLLRVHAAGICHSDLHVLGGEVPFLTDIFTLGHEVAGELIETGSAVPDRYKRGALYAVHGPNPCGECGYCRAGQDHLCNGPDRKYIGLGQDGGYAEYVKLPARNLAEVPPGVSAEVAAVATDAVLTPYHALKTLARLRPGDTMLALGLGGLGMNGVQVARHLGAHVIASDVRESAIDIARQLGADEVIHSREIALKLKGRRIDVVADFVGRESTFSQAQTLVRPGGLILVIGLGAHEVPLSPMTVASLEIRVQGSFWGTSTELREVLALIAAGRIHPQVETGKLEDVGHWLEELRQGRVRSRIALRHDYT